MLNPKTWYSKQKDESPCRECRPNSQVDWNDFEFLSGIGQYFEMLLFVQKVFVSKSHFFKIALFWRVVFPTCSLEILIWKIIVLKVIGPKIFFIPERSLLPKDSKRSLFRRVIFPKGVCPEFFGETKIFQRNSCLK